MSNYTFSRSFSYQLIVAKAGFLQLAVAGAIILLLASFNSATARQAQSDIPIVIQRLNGTINFDGMPNEAAWQQIRPLPLATYFPEDGLEPSERTEIRITYDDNYIYAGAHLYDSSPDEIQAVSYERNFRGRTNDSFSLILDTFNNNETGVGFVTAPTAARSDFSIFDDANGRNAFNYDWDTFWDVETVRNDEGWFVEMRIPVSSLRFQNQNGRVEMGLTTFRWIARKNESNIFPAFPNNWGYNGHFKPSQAQTVIFEGLESSSPFQITPYVLGGMSQNHMLNEDETGYVRDDTWTREAGLDLKTGLGGNFTMDLTVNTDFAQVEADNERVNLTRFSLFFPEKRKFFQERSDLFSFSLGGNNDLFYSRRIGIYDGQQVRILGGARVTGSVGNWDIGLINMQTARDAGATAENFGTARVKRRVFNPNSYIGAIVTSRVDEDGELNYAHGVDGVINMFNEDYLEFNLAQSFDKDAGNSLGSLDSGHLSLIWETRQITGFGYRATFAHYGDNFNPGIGFVSRSDYTQSSANINYGWFASENSSIQNQQVDAGVRTFWNLDGEMETFDIDGSWDISWKSGSSIFFSPSYTVENLTSPFTLFDDVVIPADRYGFANMSMRISTPSGRLMNAFIFLNGGQFYDGYRASASINSNVSLSQHLNLQPYYEINRVTFPDRDAAFTTHTARLRIEYYLNTKLSASSFLQYSDSSELVISNFRIRYNPREGNDLYIVYNENVNTNRLDRFPVAPLSQARTIMVKYTYTFNIQ